MKTNLLLCFYVSMSLILYSCASVKPYYQDESQTLPSAVTSSPGEIDYSLFLVGGVSLKEPSAVLEAIEKNRNVSSSGLILLGDVLSVDDLPEMEGAADAGEIAKIRRLDQSFSDLYLIPGEKEWTSGKRPSHAAISSLDVLLKDVKNEGRFIQPQKGCGEPEVISLTENAILVLIDSQWAIETENRKGEKMPGCELANVLGLRQTIKGIIQEHHSDQIIIATHHPIYANGPTAGNYPLSSHLLPVPVFGTIITGIKSLAASNQHFGHPAYEAFRSAITTAVENCKNCVVVSGHEKSLQYYVRGGRHYLVAGSGEDVAHARKGERSVFSFMSRGFVRVDAMKNKHLLVSVVAVDEAGNDRRVLEVNIAPYEGEFTGDTQMSLTSKEIGDSVLMQASTQYENKPFLRGDFYREAWSKEIMMPVLWLDKVKGGLTPLQLGGGNQTRSLRLENKDGQQYVLRSIDKKVTAVLPPALRGTFAENIVQDGIAASHPYAALVVPRLAQAAGVYYTRPSVVYVPHQAALGIYDKDIGDGVYIFEDRPGGNTEGFDNFGNTKETFSTLDVIDMVTESHKHVIDQQAALRTRLFDTWLGDWDRHDDQVRWASFKENGTTVYRPIPRDRDQIFFKNDGLLDYIGSRPYFSPALRRFDDKIDYLPGLIWSGKYFDRSFLHQLSEEDFINAAKKLQAALTDKVIDAAFKDWPAEIDALDGPQIRSFLHTRRDDLVKYATEYYRHISKEILLPATEDQDVITIHAPDNDRLHITIDRWSDDTRYPFYQRTLDDDVTREVRIFALNKRDTVRITGEGNPSIKIRVIGGTGDDYLLNESSRLHVIAYDDPEGLTIVGKDVTEHINDKPFNNTFDRTDWSLNKTIHFPLPAFYTDEGFGLTYNLWSTRYGFRSDLYKSNHVAALSYFFNTGAFIGSYKGIWPHAVGDLDFGFDGYLTGPTYTQYFYGLGNNYVNYGEKNKYHIVKGSQVKIAPSLARQFGFGSRIYLRPDYQFIDLEYNTEENRFVNSPASNLTETDFGKRHYVGVAAGYAFERLDNPGFPSRGGEVGLSVGGRTSLVETDISNALLSAEGSLYIPFNLTGSVVLATHVQADKILGDYEFFHALTLGGPDKLRGFRKDRFAGDARFLHATDLRFRIFQRRGAIPFSLGIYGSVDYGRVWYEGDDASADKWHTAFGGGLYVVPLGIAAFRLGYMVGEDDRQINLGGALRF